MKRPLPLPCFTSSLSHAAAVPELLDRTSSSSSSVTNTTPSAIPSENFLAKLLVKPPQKLFICIIWKRLFIRSEYPKKINNKLHWRHRCLPHFILAHIQQFSVIMLRKLNFKLFGILWYHKPWLDSYATTYLPPLYVSLNSSVGRPLCVQQVSFILIQMCLDNPYYDNSDLR